MQCAGLVGGRFAPRKAASGRCFARSGMADGGGSGWPAHIPALTGNGLVHCELPIGPVPVIHTLALGSMGIIGVMAPLRMSIYSLVLTSDHVDDIDHTESRPAIDM